MGMTEGPFRAVLLNAVTSGTSQPIHVANYSNLTIYLKGAGTISTGTLIVEESDFASIPNGDTWSSVTGSLPILCTDVTGGAQKAYQLPIGAYSAIRVRVGTAVTGSGGSISVVIVGN